MSSVRGRRTSEPRVICSCCLVGIARTTSCALLGGVEQSHSLLAPGELLRNLSLDGEYGSGLRTIFAKLALRLKNALLPGLQPLDLYSRSVEIPADASAGVSLRDKLASKISIGVEHPDCDLAAAHSRLYRIALGPRAVERCLGSFSPLMCRPQVRFAE